MYLWGSILLLLLFLMTHQTLLMMINIHKYSFALIQYPNKLFLGCAFAASEQRAKSQANQSWIFLGLLRFNSPKSVLDGKI